MSMLTEIDRNKRYAVEGYRGIAFYLIGFATEPPAPCQVSKMVLMTIGTV